MTIELSQEEKQRVLQTEDVFVLMQKLLQRESKIDKSKLHLWVVALDPKSRIVLVELILLGSINLEELHPSEIFSLALQKQAKRLIFCHNNGDGSLRISEESKDLTAWMIEIGRLVDVPIYDHLVINEHSYLSFREQGIQEELEQSKKWMIPRERERLLVEASRKATEQAIKKQLAKSMLAKGINKETISELTGIEL